MKRVKRSRSLPATLREANNRVPKRRKKNLLDPLHKIRKHIVLNPLPEQLQQQLADASTIHAFLLDGSRSMAGHAASVVNALYQAKEEAQADDSTFVFLLLFHGDGSHPAYLFKKVLALEKADVESFYTNRPGTPLHISILWFWEHVFKSRTEKFASVNILSDGEDWPTPTGFSYDKFTQEGKSVQAQLAKQVKDLQAQHHWKFLLYNMSRHTSDRVTESYELAEDDTSHGNTAEYLVRAFSTTMSTVRQESH